ncbi:putative endoplasmic reticulum membrane protein YGL010W-like protein [Gossypium australe]|uniref:Putative endoplasmic reticulum membrane protein YGL010W-like protein n=1 Tax=Gossypium australe TaxID=47621 RepID=A0A5B6URU8_9ROSI|nr:putative endoplasmic reticulum membrane protein YGL010W-like protein [Gossypium australe]
MAATCACSCCFIECIGTYISDASCFNPFVAYKLHWFFQLIAVVFEFAFCKFTLSCFTLIGLDWIETNFRSFLRFNFSAGLDSSLAMGSLRNEHQLYWITLFKPL